MHLLSLWFTESEIHFSFQREIKHPKRRLLINSNRSDSPAVSKWCKAWSSQGLACNQVQWPCKSEPVSQQADRTREIPSYSWREVTLHKLFWRMFSDHGTCRKQSTCTPNQGQVLLAHVGGNKTEKDNKNYQVYHDEQNWRAGKKGAESKWDRVSVKEKTNGTRIRYQAVSKEML